MTGSASHPGRAGLEAELLVRRSDAFTLELRVSIEPGQTVALLGPNGAGKSTTVEALAGLVPVDAGRISLGDRVLDDADRGVFVPPERRRLGIVFQDYLLFEHLSVAENIAFGPRSRGDGRRASLRAAQRWAEALGVAELGRRRPSQLSGGQAQRVALARALASDPELLLLDEPLAALDVRTRTRMRRTLGDHLRGFAGPTLLITHEATEAFLLADVVLVVEGGQLTQRGTPEEIRRHPATPYVADLTGTNLVEADAEEGTLTLGGAAPRLHTAEVHASGRVLVTIPPRAIALHPDEPHGSPRNAWATTVAAVEPLGETTRILLGPPLPLTADITPASAAALGLRPGVAVWAAVKATEITTTPA